MRDPDFRLIQHLTELEKAQLVRQAPDSEPTYLFKHALTQESVYQSLLKITRADLHRRVAEVIERLWAEQLDQNAAILHLHYEQAGQNDKAFHYAALSGQMAAQAFAHVEALTFFDRALHLAAILVAQESERAVTIDLGPVYIQKGRVLEVMGNHAAAVANYRAMIEFAQRVGDAAMEADGLNHLVTAQVVLAGPTPETSAQLDRALALAQRAGAFELIARTLWNRGLAHRFFEPQRAMDDFAEALRLAEAENLRELAAYVRLDSQVALALLGRGRQARASAQQALAEFRALDLKPMIADALETLAYYAITRGEPAAARAFAEEGLTISHTLANLWGILNNQLELLILDLGAGDLSCVLLRGETALQGTRQLGSPPFILNCYALLTQACLQLNQLTRAHAWADEAAGAFGSDKGSVFSHWAHWLQAMVLIKEGEEARARTLLTPLIQRNEFPLTPFDRYGWVGQTMAELALLENRLDEGLELCSGFLRRFEQQEQAGLAAAMYYWRAKLHHARGDVMDAEQDALRASELLAMAENRILLWRADALLADIYQARGNETAARKCRDDARTSIQYIAEHSPLELRESLLGADEIRQVMSG